ncbi:TPA: hypothetical protein N0F65_000639 [Lagenidium giganteum]|uniref:HD domain-containing protein n=1 Tax=Lagenidium giganteum TaxID=4803 RepID=A0AAV2YPF9_9STRA|nr:TPA: hypothetical protein N0F65_000639 [Lagenidium giganteum]
MSKMRRQETLFAAFGRQVKPSVKRAKASGDGTHALPSHAARTGAPAWKRLPAADDEDDGIVTDNDVFSSQEEATNASPSAVHGSDVRVRKGKSEAAVVSQEMDSVSDEESEKHVFKKKRKAEDMGAVQMDDEASNECDSMAVTAFTTEMLQMPLHTKKVVKDSVHGVMTFEPICMRIIDTLQFQRLRNLHQLGAANFVYIGATHSRFEHCLGVAHLAERMAQHIREQQPWLRPLMTDRDILCIKIAGLCHDLGHGPFSHVFDGIFRKQLRRRSMVTTEWTHEQGSLDMLDHLIQANSINVARYDLSEQDIVFIKEMIFGGPLPGGDGNLRGRPHMSQRFLYDFVNNGSSGLDVDKLDYFIRDAFHTGTKPAVDTDLLIRSARVLADREDSEGKLTICFPEKLAFQVMQAFRTRFELHQTVYQHKAIRAVEYMICDAFLAANDYLLIKGTRISDIVHNMEAYQHLDDRIMSMIQLSDKPELEDARQALLRIYTKPYYQCIGKTSVTLHSKKKSENDLTREILCCSPRRNLVDASSSIIVEFVKVHHGKGSLDPVQHVRFYRKDATASDHCYRLPEMAYSAHCPRSFMEHSIRVFVKEMRLIQPVREAFEIWSRKFNHSEVFPMSENDDEEA